MCTHHPRCSRIAMTHLSALDDMVRKAAGTNQVVLVEGALEEFVRVTVRPRIFKAADKNPV